MDTTTKVEQPAVDVIMTDLNDAATDLLMLIERLKIMQENGFFRYVSKTQRNQLLHGLIDSIAKVEDIGKQGFKALKKVKRERVPDELVDSLLGATFDAALTEASLREPGDE